LYSSRNVTGVIKWRRRWAVGACMGDMKHGHTVLVGKPWKNLGVDGR